jgi:predicted metal-dependent phosphoesterase TrpH
MSMRHTATAFLSSAIALVSMTGDVAAQASAPARFTVPTVPANAQWFKGNTHTHTTNSDGDTPPEAVARWYKNHGYRFLVLSDHNVFTNPATLASLMDSTFLLVPGEEVTTSFQSASVHVNALDISRLIPAPKGASLVETVQNTIDAIRAERAVPHINHPNFRWSLDTAVLWRVKNDRLLEIHNGHPTVHNDGGGDTPGMEDAWDALLTRGKRLYGIAVDDAHHFQGEFAPERANPGRGWVVVQATSLNGRALVEALDAGHFYASSGPVLEAITATDTSLTIRITRQGDFKYTTQFVGANGRVLAVDKSLTPRYTLRGDETYVRARVVDSGGRVAWVQPVFTTRYLERRP